jgi:large subunit ribosomal protein L22
MKASLRSYRIAPKKANLVAKMIRGMTVDDALSTLERTNKKAARVLKALVESAIANAQHNENQNPENLVIKSLIVNQAQAYHRGVPMARGRVRPMRKFLSHIELTLGVASEETTLRQSSGQENQKPMSAEASAKAGKTKQDSSSPSALSSGPRGKSQKSESSQKEVKMASQSPEKNVKTKGSDKSAESGKGSFKKKTAPTPKVSAEKDSPSKEK